MQMPNPIVLCCGTLVKRMTFPKRFLRTLVLSSQYVVAPVKPDISSHWVKPQEFSRRFHFQSLVGMVLIVILEPVWKLPHDVLGRFNWVDVNVIAFEGFYECFGHSVALRRVCGCCASFEPKELCKLSGLMSCVARSVVTEPRPWCITPIPKRQSLSASFLDNFVRLRYPRCSGAI